MIPIDMNNISFYEGFRIKAGLSGGKGSATINHKPPNVREQSVSRLAPKPSDDYHREINKHDVVQVVDLTREPPKLFGKPGAVMTASGANVNSKVPFFRPSNKLLMSSH